jgi:hypothetical protein
MYIHNANSSIVDKPIPPANVLNVYKQDFIQVFGVAYTTHSEYDQLRHIGLNGYKELLFTLGCLAPNEVSIGYTNRLIFIPSLGRFDYTTINPCYS